ncbi:nuclease-like protein [Melghiribacillus thermohalophilus]|uniref:Nuclease-like protein n=1 Tax=Melghiribacillus thermohalophilus TaxID=1324956 RepID=A0A4R3MUD2_9BACI|nr:nuclease-related domain-containing protein [Melghiribacillus thermohalophilus]TCT19347.1 nuclease-like protein [Melghiribacillus thermohalophilus]
MIVLPHKKPPILHQLEALIPRLSSNDPLYPKLKDLLLRKQSGYQGELSLDYYYQQLGLDSFPILHGLRLPNHHHSCFQMDTLILFPEFFLVIEVKNFTGIVTYDSQTGLLTQETSQGGIKRFDDPKMQTLIQKQQLLIFLKKLGLQQIPSIHSLIVFSNPNVILKLNGHEPDFILAQKLMERIPLLQKQHNQRFLSHQELIALGQHLIKAHTPNNQKVIEEYNIHPSRIQNGVWCTNCRVGIMTWKKRNWHCQKCFHKDKLAHIPALQEYGWIYGPVITNYEARKFLGVSSMDTAKHLVISAGCEKRGNNRGRKYLIKLDD